MFVIVLVAACTFSHADWEFVTSWTAYVEVTAVRFSARGSSYWDPLSHKAEPFVKLFSPWGLEFTTGKAGQDCNTNTWYAVSGTWQRNNVVPAHFDQMGVRVEMWDDDAGAADHMMTGYINPRDYKRISGTQTVEISCSGAGSGYIKVNVGLQYSAQTPCASRTSNSGVPYCRSNLDSNSELCYQQLNPKGDGTYDGTCRVTCPTSISTANSSYYQCRLKDCDARQTNLSHTYPCGSSSCARQLNRSSNGSYLTSCNSTCPEGISTKSLNGNCVLKPCVDRLADSYYTYPCATSNCYQQLDPAGAGTWLSGSAGSCKSECGDGISDINSSGKCTLKSCTNRKPGTSRTYPCGTSNCYQQSASCVASCGSHAKADNRSICQDTECTDRVPVTSGGAPSCHKDADRDDSPCAYFAENGRCVSVCPANYKLQNEALETNGKRYVCQALACNERKSTTNCSLPSDSAETPCKLFDGNCYVDCPLHTNTYSDTPNVCTPTACSSRDPDISSNELCWASKDEKCYLLKANESSCVEECSPFGVTLNPTDGICTWESCSKRSAKSGSCAAPAGIDDRACVNFPNYDLFGGKYTECLEAPCPDNYVAETVPGQSDALYCVALPCSERKNVGGGCYLLDADQDRPCKSYEHLCFEECPFHTITVNAGAGGVVCVSTGCGTRHPNDEEGGDGLCRVSGTNESCFVRDTDCVEACGNLSVENIPDSGICTWAECAKRKPEKIYGSFSTCAKPDNGDDVSNNTEDVSNNTEAEACYLHEGVCMAKCPSGFHPGENDCVKDDSQGKSESRNSFPFWIIIVIVVVVVVVTAVVIVVVVVVRRKKRGEALAKNQKTVLFLTDDTGQSDFSGTQARSNLRDDPEGAGSDIGSGYGTARNADVDGAVVGE